MTAAQRTEIFTRAHTELVHAPAKRPVSVLAHPSRIADRLLVVVMDGEDLGSRPWTWGLYRVLARQDDGTYSLATPTALNEPVQGVIVGDAAPARDRRRSVSWSWNHAAPVLPVQEFLHHVLLREGYRHGAAIVAYQLPAVLASLAMTWGSGREMNRGAWTVWFCPQRHTRRTSQGGRSNHRTVHPDCPGVRITPRRPPMAFFAFSRPYQSGRWRIRHHPGRWGYLREKCYVLTGADHSFESALRAFGMDAPPGPASGSVTDRLDALLARLDATSRLAEATLHELRRHPVLTGENEIERRTSTLPRAGLLDPHSPAGLLRVYMRAMGIAGPPSLAVRADLSTREVTGAAATAFHAPRAETLTRCTPERSVMLDVRSCFPAAALLQGLDAWWAAGRLIVEEIPPETAQAELDTATPEHYLDLTRWRTLTELYLVQPRDAVLPVTIPVREGEQRDLESVLAAVTIPEALGPVWYTKADLLISRFRTGHAERILRALRFRADGERSGLRSIDFRGAVSLDPRHLITSLVHARRTLEAQGFLHAAAAAKLMANVAAYGIAAELHRVDNRVIRRRRDGTDERVPKRTVVVCDGVRTYRATPDFYEAPGGHTCWPLASFTVAGSRFLVELVEQGAHIEGGALAVVFTDAGAVVSRNGAPPEQIARAVMQRMESLNPFGDLVRPFLKPQDGTADAPQAVQVYGVSTPAYTRFERVRPDHRGPRTVEILKPNGWALSMFLDPVRHRLVRQGDGAPAWWSDAWRFMLGHARPGRGGAIPPWLDEPAVQVFGYQSPIQEPAVQHLHYFRGGPIRPFAQLYLRHYFDGADMGQRREELLLALTPPRAGREYETYRRALVLHVTRPERKMANAWDIGPMERHVLEATAILHFGRETPPTVGQEHPTGGAMTMGAPQVYEPIPTRKDIREACRLLRRHPTTVVARLLDRDRRWLPDVLHGRRQPSGETIHRLVELANTIRVNGGVLPSHETSPHKKPPALLKEATG